MADRAVKFAIGASIALAIMCFQGWWRLEGLQQRTFDGIYVDGLTSFGDGVLVLAGSVLTCVSAFLALVRPAARRAASATIMLASAAMFVVLMYDLLNLPPRDTALLDFVNMGFGYYHATPILYFAALTSVLIGLAGFAMALARPDRTSSEQVDEGVTAWA